MGLLRGKGLLHSLMYKRMLRRGAVGMLVVVLLLLDHGGDGGGGGKRLE